MSNEVETVEARARRLVDQEVNVCLSSLVYTLTKGYGGVVDGGRDARDLSDLCEQAFELSCPLQDYEGAAYEAGWREAGGEPSGTVKRAATADEREDNLDQPWVYAHSWEQACETDDLEPHDREVFEHWAVSQWFGIQLQNHGEKVDFDFAGMVVWARTTTGQAICADGVVERIAAELLKA